jgi:cation diffusion facilitator family transporter
MSTAHPHEHPADSHPADAPAHAHDHAGHEHPANVSADAHDHAGHEHPANVSADAHDEAGHRDPADAPAHRHDQAGHHHPADGHDHQQARGGPWATLGHFFGPHSHDAADSIDNALEGSAEGIRVVKFSLLALGLTAVLQLVVVLTTGSVALLADTIHNFADASTAIPLWLAFSIGRRAANRRYTYGYGRAEDLAGVFVVLVIVASSLVAGWESIQKLLHPEPITNLGWVALAGLLGFVGNELVAQYRIGAGRRIGSAALVADGYHARTDGLTSLAVVVGAAGVWLGWAQADPLVGLAITGAILLVLKDAAVQVWHRLMDAVDPDMIQRAEEAASHADGVEHVTDVRARWVGHTIVADAQIVADSELTLAQAHSVAERVRHAMLHAVPKLADVRVHVDPCAHSGIDHHAALAHHDMR